MANYNYKGLPGNSISNSKALISIKYDDSKLTKFLKELKALVPTYHIALEEALLELAAVIKPIINKGFEDDADQRWAAFMQPRTKVEVLPVMAGLRITVSGYTEGQIPADAPAPSGAVKPEYNIWAVQEFGYTFGERISTGKPFVWQKDTGGVPVFSKSIPARTVKKNMGKVQRLVKRVETQIIAIAMQIALRGARKFLIDIINEAGGGLLDLSEIEEQLPSSYELNPSYPVYTSPTGITQARSKSGHFGPKVNLGGSTSVNLG